MLDVTHVFANFPEIETNRCLLRAVVPDDMDDVFEYMSDDQVTQYLPWPSATTLDEVTNRIERYHQVYADGTGVVWGIINKSNSRLMGTCLLWNFTPAHYRAELGYVLGAKWWRQGFMMEVTSAVVSYAFSDIGFHSLEAHIDPENIGSKRLLEKLGFVQEAYFRENYYDSQLKAFTDTAVFSLLETNWRTNSNL